jgi:predicted SprT family Zn-dependent metalloprotease
MVESPTCPTPRCPDKGKPMSRADLRRHDTARKITRYACPSCGQEIAKRTA